MIVTVGLAACGEGSETEEKEVSGVESTDNSDDSANGEEAAEETDEEDGSKEEFDQEIVDNDNFKATLTSVEKIVDKDWDEEKIEVTFEEIGRASCRERVWMAVVGMAGQTRGEGEESRLDGWHRV